MYKSIHTRYEAHDFSIDWLNNRFKRQGAWNFTLQTFGPNSCQSAKWFLHSGLPNLSFDTFRLVTVRTGFYIIKTESSRPVTITITYCRGNVFLYHAMCKAIDVGPLRTLVTDDHCMLHWFCELDAWPCYCYRSRLTPGNCLVFKITTLTHFTRYGMVTLHTNQFSGVNLLLMNRVKDWFTMN